MINLLGIHSGVFKTILEKMFCMLTEAGSSCHGVLGLFTKKEGLTRIALCGDVHPGRTEEMEHYLFAIREGRIEKIPGTQRFHMATPHAITAYDLGELIVAVYSPAGDPWDEAAAVVYGHYHLLYDKYNGVVGDDLFVDMLLSHVGEWQKKNQSNNEVLTHLAQSVFKPEVLHHR